MYDFFWMRAHLPRCLSTGAPCRLAEKQVTTNKRQMRGVRNESQEDPHIWGVVFLFFKSSLIKKQKQVYTPNA